METGEFKKIRRPFILSYPYMCEVGCSNRLKGDEEGLTIYELINQDQTNYADLIRDHCTAQCNLMKQQDELERELEKKSREG